MGGASGKILDPGELLSRREAARAAGRRVVQCHGCFDIVHPGHLRHLKFAKSQGDVLLVTITGDAAIRKGTGRPLIPQELRAENLAELDCVDWVSVDDSATAQAMLERVRPDVYIKGREYEFNNDPRFRAERETVERHGGRVVFSSGDVVFSSTALIEALSASEEGSMDPAHRRLAQLLCEPELASHRLGDLIGRFRGQRVVVIGEVIRDTYVFCDRPDVAGESPIMTLRPVEHRVYDGGAAIVARHAAALGAEVTLVTALPDDAFAAELRARLLSEGVEVVWVQATAPIAEKQRFLVGASKVMKVDLVEQSALDAGLRDDLLGLARGACAGGVDAAMVTDFGLGLLTPTALTRLTAALRPLVGVLSGDVSGRQSGLRSMKRLDLVCPSESELRDAYRNFGDGLPAVTWELLSETETSAAIVTMGPEGAIGFRRIAGSEERGGWRSRLRGEHVPALSPHAVDQLGCGDALLSSATLSLAAGGSLLAGTYLGSVAAGIAARTLGNTPIDAATLRREVLRVSGSHVQMASAGELDGPPVGRRDDEMREAG